MDRIVYWHPETVCQKSVRLIEFDGGHRADGFWIFQQAFDLLEELFAKLDAIVAKIACHSVAFEILPDSLDWIEVGTIGWLINWLDRVPDEPFGFVPTRIV